MTIRNFIIMVVSVVITYGFALDVIIYNIKDEDRYVAACWCFVAMMVTIIVGIINAAVFREVEKDRLKMLR